MKKTVSLILTFVFLLSLAACSGGNGSEPITDAQGNTLPSNLPSGSVSSIKEKFDQMEYALYCNIFYDNQGSDYEGKTLTKEGTFAIIQDEWSEKDRYYVWGYSDQTRCCDFQWEFVPDNINDLPPVGSFISVTGTFTYTEDQKTGALDHYWLTDTSVTVIEEYTNTDYDYDLTLMSATLARVQIFSLQNYTEAFEGKTVRVYGRAYSTSIIQHPYYDESWYLSFVADGKAPATGTYLILGGTLSAGAEGCILNVSSYTEV